MVVIVKPKELSREESRMGLEKSKTIKMSRMPQTSYGIRPLRSQSTGQLITGVEYMTENLDFDESLPESKENPKQILKRTEMEKKLGFPKDIGGTVYTDLSPSSKFWEIKVIRLKANESSFYDTAIPEQELDVCILKKYLPLSTQNPLPPGTEFVIFEQEKVDEIQETKNSVERKAIKKFMELSEADIKKYGVLSGCIDVTGNQSPDFLSNTLYTYVKENPKAFLDLTNRSKEDTQLEMQIQEAINLNVLKRKDGFIVRGEDGKQKIGHDMITAKEFLGKEDNQEILGAIIRETLERKTK